MREIVLMGAYTDKITKEITLIESIMDWKKYNIPIILSTHYPVSEKIQNMVDYYVFDKEQHLDWKLVNLQTYTCNIVHLVAKYERPYHAAAGLIAFANALRLVHDKYDLIYIQDYDVLLDKSKLLSQMKELYQTNKEIFMFKWPGLPNAYATNVGIFKKDSFYKLWGDIQSVDDYFKQVRSTKTNNTLIEQLARNIIKTHGLEDIVHLFDDNSTKEILLDSSKHTANLQAMPKIYLSSTNDNRVILFLVNTMNHPVEFEISDQSFSTGRKKTHVMTVPGNINIFWELFDPGRELTVNCRGFEMMNKSYVIFPEKIYDECQFRFSNPNGFKCYQEI